jgi:cell division protein FtsB
MARARSGTPGGRSGSRVGGWTARVVWVSVAASLVWTALAEGEYDTLELLQQSATRDSLAAVVSALEVERDSLRRSLEAVRTDPWRLEQLAREEHGMVRGDKELLYRLSRSPSVEADPPSGSPPP